MQLLRYARSDPVLSLAGTSVTRLELLQVKGEVAKIYEVQGSQMGGNPWASLNSEWLSEIACKSNQDCLGVVTGPQACWVGPPAADSLTGS